MNFLFICQKHYANGYTIEIFKWVFTLMDFMDFSLKNFKMISPYQLTFFNMGFNLVLRAFISD